MERRQASAPASGGRREPPFSVARPARRLRAGKDTMRLPAFRFLYFRRGDGFSSSSLPDNRVRPEVAGPAVNLIRQSMRTESLIGFADRLFRTAGQHGPPGRLWKRRHFVPFAGGDEVCVASSLAKLGREKTRRENGSVLLAALPATEASISAL